jgi:hypothetical protein
MQDNIKEETRNSVGISEEHRKNKKVRRRCRAAYS